LAMRHRKQTPVVWIPGLLNRMVIYSLIMTGFMLLFYIFSGRQQFSDRTVNGIIELALVFSVGSFFLSLCAIAGRILRNRYVSHLKKQKIGPLIAAMVSMVMVTLLFSLLSILQTGYGY